MSTFNGIVAEFPDIRIDYFRRDPNFQDVKACFLSHVHSDHLTGLESLRSPSVYCSAATKELLLRLERYQDRINFAKGVLESRQIRYDQKRFKGLLRPIPLNVPTEIELSPVRKIRVTLLPANHCPGSVMFLIESEVSAVLYTGDIRAEPWWINMISRSPVMIPYSTGTRTLDKIYLDTTNAYSSSISSGFVTNAGGIAELIRKVVEYPPDTIFHINSWTLGYEDVFVALSAALGCKVHVDEYKMRLYSSLAQSSERIPPEESLALCGFKLGHGQHEGCLTTDPRTRLHTCELGMECKALKPDKTVYIRPVIARTRDGFEIEELGAAAGTGDLDLAHEIDLSSPDIVDRLLLLCAEHLNGSEALQRTKEVVTKASSSGRKTLAIPSVELPEDLSDLSTKQLLDLLLRTVDVQLSSRNRVNGHELDRATASGEEQLRKRITFPFSRHSSHKELCDFLSVFKPKDIYPCTVEESTWHPGISIKALFGNFSSSRTFSHDTKMSSFFEKEFRRVFMQTEGEEEPPNESQTPEPDTQGSQSSSQNVADQGHRTAEDVPNKPELAGDDAPPRLTQAIYQIYDSHSHDSQPRDSQGPSRVPDTYGQDFGEMIGFTKLMEEFGVSSFYSSDEEYYNSDDPRKHAADDTEEEDDAPGRSPATPAAAFAASDNRKRKGDDESSSGEAERRSKHAKTE